MRFKPIRTEAPNEADSFAERLTRARVAAGLEKNETEEEEEQASSSGWLRIGSDFVATILASIGLGWLADSQFGTVPWCMLFMLFAGFAVAVVNIWRVINGMKPTVEWRAPDTKKKKEKA